MSDSKRTSSSFLQRYLNGEAQSDDIDDFIDSWHEKPGKKQIFEFLGMTKEEYSLWLCDPERLAEIARARRTNALLTDVVRDVLAEMPEGRNSKAEQLMRWLEQSEIHPAK